MLYMTSKIRARKFKKDRNGGIEGLPLQLMILVLIAGVGSAVMVGWMSNLETPMSISSVYADPGEIVLSDDDKNGVYENDEIDMTIHVLDQDGNGIEGVTVVLDGCGIFSSSGTTVYGKTDATGMVVFDSLSASHVGGRLAFVTVSATKNGYGMDASYTIPVVCG